MIKNRGVKDTFKIALNILNPFENTVSFKHAISKNKEVYEAIFEQVKKSKPKVEFLVDSSKDPRRLYELVKDMQINEEDIYVIYLVRDARAYVNSFRKDIIQIKGLENRSIFITMFEWFIVHFFSRKVLKKHELNYKEIRYHEFVEEPHKYIQEIFEFIGIKPPGELTELIKKINTGEYHNLHGNPLRFKKIKEIKHDLSWKEQLNYSQKIISNIVLFPLNKMWVYGKKL